MRKLGTTLAGVTLALAALGGALIDAAGATSPPDTRGDTSGTLDPGPRHVTGSANLDRLADALAMSNVSVRVEVSAPGGLQLTRPVEVVGIFGTDAVHVSRTYSTVSGLSLVHEFDPGDGRPRREPVVITLAERDVLSGRILASYVIRTGADVEALWDVTISPLRVTFWQQCDDTSAADPHVAWRNANGVHHVREFDPDLGETVTIDDGFAGTFPGARASDPIFQPSVNWAESDVGQFNPAGAPDNTDDPLLPTADQDNQFELVENGGDCSASFSYRVRAALRR
jgi:hypothetical protein